MEDAGAKSLVMDRTSKKEKREGSSASRTLFSLIFDGVQVIKADKLKYFATDTTDMGNTLSLFSHLYALWTLEN